MTEDAIGKKLGDQLASKDALTEARVVYILAEIRKLLDRTKARKKYHALRFHCSWALHTTMDRGEGVRRILQRFDEAYKLPKGKHLGDLPKKLSNELRSTVGLERFRADLEAFLIAHRLPINVVNNEDWTKFLQQYVGVVEDCELTIKDEALSVPKAKAGKTARKLQNIKYVTVHKEGGGTFRIRWVSHGKDNKTRTCHSDE